MMRTPVAIRGHCGGITVTVLSIGPSGPYIHDMYADGRPAHLHPSIESAQAEADDVVRVVGHECGETCTSWRLLD